MQFRLFNTLGRTKAVFSPSHPGHVSLYVCGVTVYDDCHLGHARAAVVFDVLSRWLRSQGLKVTYVRNFTDIDDKIINRAREAGIAWDTLAQKYIEAYTVAMGRLKNIPPDREPRATHHIGEMIAAIEKLLDKGFAYRGGPDVFFSVRSFPSYGTLSGKRIEDLASGARVEIDENKRDPLDFVLWKGVKPGEPSWPAPFGAGRPGWHIECSAMCLKYLGAPVDIHGGGRDLIFPHHENERAQAEAETGVPFARFWMHNGFVNIDSEKMAKSTGQFKYLREVLDRYDADTIRHFLLSAHYSGPLDYSVAALDESERAVERCYVTLKKLQPFRSADKRSARANPQTEAEKNCWAMVSSLSQKMQGALADDLNTAQAVGALFEAVREINRCLDQGVLAAEFLGSVANTFTDAMEICHRVLGIFHDDADVYLEKKRSRVLDSKSVDRAHVEQLIAERLAARRAGNFKRADEIRAALALSGVELRDSSDGTTQWWVR